MRLRAAVGGAFWSTTALSSAAFGQDIGVILHRRHLELHPGLLKRDSASFTPTPTSSSGNGGVFGVTAWPTVSIPAGFTLAGGVQITPMPVMAMSSVTGTAAFSSAMSAATEVAYPATWNQQVETACQNAVGELDGSSGNPSGMVACYNIAYLDTAKGRFEADLRIYNVSSSSGAFANVLGSDMMVTLAYTDAQLSTNSSFPVKRSVQLVKRQAASSGVFIPTEVMSQNYIVQLNNGSYPPGMHE